MKKNIAIALNAGTPTIRNGITDYFRTNSLVFWHWIDDFWIVEVDLNVTPKSLHAELIGSGSLTPSNTILVYEFNGPIKYWGRGAKEGWDWLSRIGKSSN